MTDDSSLISQLLAAAASEDVLEMQRLICGSKSKANVNIMGCTALHVATMLRDRVAVRLLLVFGVSPATQCRVRTRSHSHSRMREPNDRIHGSFSRLVPVIQLGFTPMHLTLQQTPIDVELVELLGSHDNGSALNARDFVRAPPKHAHARSVAGHSLTHSLTLVCICSLSR